jgi:hypothetical protein
MVSFVRPIWEYDTEIMGQVISVVKLNHQEEIMHIFICQTVQLEQAFIIKVHQLRKVRFKIKIKHSTILYGFTKRTIMKQFPIIQSNTIHQITTIH